MLALLAPESESDSDSELIKPFSDTDATLGRVSAVVVVVAISS